MVQQKAFHNQLKSRKESLFMNRPMKRLRLILIDYEMAYGGPTKRPLLD